MRLDNMNERELLVLVIEKVSKLEEKFTGFNEDLIETKLKVRELETKIKLYAGIIAVVASSAVSIIFNLLSN